MGYQVSTSEILAVSQAAVEYVSAHYGRAHCFVIGDTNLDRLFADHGHTVTREETPVDAVVIGQTKWAHFGEIDIARRLVEDGAEPIAMHKDPTWPDGIRSMLASMSMGTIGDPVMVDGGYAILLLESVESASEVAFESVKEEMTRRARLGVEHDAMDRLAREIVRSADLVIMHRSLNKTWQRKRAEILAEAR